MSNIIKLTRWGDGQSIYIQKESINCFYRDKMYDEDELNVIANEEFPSSFRLTERDIDIIKSKAHFHMYTKVIVANHYEFQVVESIEDILQMLD